MHHIVNLPLVATHACAAAVNPAARQALLLRASRSVQLTRALAEVVRREVGADEAREERHGGERPSLFLFPRRLHTEDEEQCVENEGGRYGYQRIHEEAQFRVPVPVFFEPLQDLFLLHQVACKREKVCTRLSVKKEFLGSACVL